MQQQRYLLDEALASEPIKNTLQLTWEFIVLNKKFTLTAITLFFVLNILTPYLGLLAIVPSGLFSLIIQIYFSRLIYHAQDIEELIENIKGSKVEEAVSKNAFVAVGAYIAWVILFIVLLFIVGLIIKNSGVPLENVKTVEELMPVAQILFLPIAILTLFVSYIHPLVLSNIALAEDFKEGFLAPFTLFSPSLWKASFKNGYPKYIVMIMGLTFVGALLLGIFMSLPIINIVAGFILVIVMYGYMVLSSVVAMMGRRMIENE